jgi:hypothetical protein
MTSRHNEQRERRDLAGSTSATTFHQLASLGDQSLGSRFAAGGEVSGAQEETHYPRLPEGSPWSHDPVPPEAPLGFSVEDVEPCGTSAEIAASLDRLGSGESEAASDPAPSPPPVSLAGEGGVMGLTDAPSAEFSEAHPNLLQRRK